MDPDAHVQLFLDTTGLVWLPLVAERLFAAHVREGREARGWTQAALAEELTVRGVPLTESDVAAMERSDDATRRAVRLNEAAAVAALFHRSLRDLTQTWASDRPEQRRLVEAEQRHSEAAAALALARRDLATAEDDLARARAALVGGSG
jgi:transcriptional regulator with XRE-family HTH domain